MSMNSWTRAKYGVGGCAGFSILARKLPLRVLSTLGMLHQFIHAASRNVWRELVNSITLQRIHRVAIICGPFNSSLSPLKRNIKELVKFYEIHYGEKICRQKVITCFQIMVKLLLSKVAVNILSNFSTKYLLISYTEKLFG